MGEHGVHRGCPGEGDNGRATGGSIGALEGRFSRRRLLLSYTMEPRQTEPMLVVGHHGGGPGGRKRVGQPSRTEVRSRKELKKASERRWPRRQRQMDYRPREGVRVEASR
jgi:hypothetical protein